MTGPPGQLAAPRGGEQLAEPRSRDQAERRGRDQPAERWRLEQMVVAVFVLAAVVYAVCPVITNYDSYPAFPTAVSMVNRGTLSLDAFRHVHALTSHYGIGWTHGDLLTVYPWVIGLFAIPSVIAIDVVHLFGGPSADAVVAAHGQVQSLAQLWSASVVTALAMAALAYLAYRRLGGTPRSRRWLGALCGLVCAFGTSAWSVDSRALWQHGPAVLALSLGLVALDRLFPRHGPPTAYPRATAAAAGAVFLAAFAIRPTNAVMLAAVALLVAWRAPSRLVAYLLGAAAAAVPWLVVNEIFYGSLLQPYDSANKLALPATFADALAANLVSPARGLLVFSPIALAAVAGAAVAWRRHGLGALELLAVVVVPVYAVVVSLYPAWWAGSTYGPRLMAETVPFLLVLALPLVDWLRRARAGDPRRWPARARAIVGVVAALAVLSVVVNAEGAALRESICWNGVGTPHNVDLHPSRVWSWSDAQFTYAFRVIAADGFHPLASCSAPP